MTHPRSNPTPQWKPWLGTESMHESGSLQVPGLLLAPLCARLRGVLPGDVSPGVQKQRQVTTRTGLMVSLREETSGFGEGNHPKYIFLLVEKTKWFVIFIGCWFHPHTHTSVCYRKFPAVARYVAFEHHPFVDDCPSY